MIILAIHQKDIWNSKIFSNPRNKGEQNPQKCQNKMDVHA
jgi:hypothetical protein